MNSEIKPKKYRLLKDLPNIKAGATLTAYGYGYYKFDELGANGAEYQWGGKVVENTPEWFEEIIPEWVDVPVMVTAKEVCKCLTNYVQDFFLYKKETLIMDADKLEQLFKSKQKA